MGSTIVGTIVDGFTEGGTGLASGCVQLFDGLTKTADGTLTGVAEVGFTLVGVSLVIAVTLGLFRKLSHRVR